MESRQVNDLLEVREEESAYLVVRQQDDTDWLVRFEKAPDFSAREWAQNMVEAYNDRYSDAHDDNPRWTARPPEITVPGGYMDDEVGGV